MHLCNGHQTLTLNPHSNFQVIPKFTLKFGLQLEEDILILPKLFTKAPSKNFGQKVALEKFVTAIK